MVIAETSLIQKLSVIGKIMLFTVNWILLIFVILSNVLESYGTEDPKQTCMNQFEYQYDVIKKLVWLEENVGSLLEANQEAVRKIERLTRDLESATLSADGGTYTRWGRTDCPEGATLVYQGYAAGGKYTHEGTGANKLCLTYEPTWNYYTNTVESNVNQIYGTEYNSNWYDKVKGVYNQDVPCSVCRIPRSNVLMIPGTNICPANYKVEYIGYIMSGLYTHKAPTEFICVDDNPESVDGGAESYGQSLLYFVQAACGSLKCPPYEKGREVTCAVCSYSYRTSNYAPEG